jgi:hypothetical protein
VLQHKDEILAGRARLFYSAESRPEVVTFRAEQGERRRTCPVCRGPIRDGELAVRCPGCQRWYHEIPESAGKPPKKCWSYSPTCSFCRHPTALSGDAVWHPEMEEADA